MKTKFQWPFGRYGRGTATLEMMDYLGIAEKEKYVLFSALPLISADGLIKKIKSKVKKNG